MMPVNPNGLWEVETTVCLNDRVRRGARSAALRFGINYNHDFEATRWRVADRYRATVVSADPTTCSW